MEQDELLERGMLLADELPDRRVLELPAARNAKKL